MTKDANGCWTCRLRRKKCDADAMPCTACKSRDIDCDGYGPKPDWMDRGPKERQRAIEVQQAIRAARKRGLRLSSGQHDLVPEPPMNETTFGPLGNTKHPNIQSIPVDPQAGSRTSLQLPSPLDSIDAMESQILSSVDEAIQLFPYPRHSSSMTVSDNTWLNVACEDSGFLCSDYIPEEIFGELENNDECTIGEVNSLFPEDIRDHVQYYITHSFPNQFPCCEYENKRFLQQSLVKYLHENSTFLTSCLCISASSQLLAYHDNLTSIQRSQLFADVRRYRAQTIEDIKIMAKNCASQEIVEPGQCMSIIPCASNMASLHLLKDDINDWEEHLQNATSSLSQVFGCRSRTVLTAKLRIEDDKTIRDQQKNSEHEIADLFSNIVIQADILTNAFRGTVPKLVEEYQTLLRNNVLCIPQTTGLENWVLLEVLEITLLEDRKIREGFQGILSVRELVTRSLAIESSLQRRLQFYQSAGNTCTKYQTLNHIFTTAALIYLNVVVSGACTGVPEIQGWVSKIMELFDDVRDLRIMKSLLWPYCISACLARPEQRQRFRDILTPLDQDKLLVGKLAYLRAIVEECWKNADNSEGPSTCDWRTAMKRLDLRILFL